MKNDTEIFESLSMRNDYKEWFKKEATVFREIDRNQSKKLMEFANCKMRECYANSARNARNGFIYYEGYVKSPKIPIWIQHAFLVYNGKVVDPTLAINDRIEEGTVYIGKEFYNPMIQMVKKKIFSPLLMEEFIDYLNNKNDGVSPT